MDRRFALTVAVITICAALMLPMNAFAQEKPDSSSDGFALLHMLKQGQTLRYKVVQQISGTRTLPGASKPGAINCELTSVIGIKCMKNLGDSGMELAAKTESISVKMAGRDPRSMPPPKDARTYRIDQYGRTVDIKGNVTSAASVTRSVLDVAWLECLAILPTFPESAVKAGSDWIMEIANPLQTDSKIKISAKLEDLKETKDGWITTVKETIGLPEGQPAEINPDAPGGRIEGQVELKYIADKGRMLSAQGTLKTDTRSMMGVPGLPKSDVPTGSAYSLKVEQFSCKFTIETLPASDVSKSSGR